MFERLDRCLGYLEWKERFADAKVDHLDLWCSDHWPLLLTFSESNLGVRCGKNEEILGSILKKLGLETQSVSVLLNTVGIFFLLALASPF